MADMKNEQFTFPVGHALNADHLKAGEHTLVIPIPDEINTLIGKVIVHWGAFELRMDKVIEAILLRLHRKGPKNWQMLSFRKRKELFKGILTDYTTQLFPAETATFQRIADQSGDIHWRRNTVVHGYVIVRAKPKAPPETGHDLEFVATGTHNKKPVEIPLDKPNLEKIWHDAAHLGGNMMAAISRMGGRLENATPEFVIADKDLLQGPPHGSFRFLPMTNKRKPPPEPSGE